MFNSYNYCYTLRINAFLLPHNKAMMRKENKTGEFANIEDKEVLNNGGRLEN